MYIITNHNNVVTHRIDINVAFIVTKLLASHQKALNDIKYIAKALLGPSYMDIQPRT